MSILPRIAAPRVLPAVALLLAAGACAPAPSATTALSPAATTTAASPPVLLSCPTGQQPLLRQVAVGNTLVPQVECVTAPGSAVQPGLAPVAVAPVQPTYTPIGGATSPAAVAPTPVAWAPEPRPVPVRTVTRRPAARRVVYDDVEEIERPSRRSWQKSALIIGSAAGVGAGVGAATGGKKGALIGAAVGGGAATLWDQVTRRQPR